MADWVTLIDKLGLQLRPIDTWPGQQYRGWVALPAPDTTARDASDILVKLAGLEPGRYETGHQTVVEELRRKALKRVHPDHGGSLELMEELNRVVKILTIGDK